MQLVRRYPIAAVNLGIVLSIAMVALGFVVFGMMPMAERLSQQLNREIDFFRDNAAAQIGDVIENHIDIVRHTASRTVIRQRLAAYNRGEISREALVEFSAPKLADGFQAADSARGVSRYDARGELVVELGEPVSPEYVLSGPQRLDGIVVRGPVEHAGGSRLLYYSPLEQPPDGIIGYDIVVMDAGRLRAIVDTPFGAAGTLFLLRDDFVLFAGSRGDQSAARAAALDALVAGRGVGDRFRVDSVVIDPPGWRLYLVVDLQVFLAPLRRDILTLFLYVMVATAMVTVLGFLVLQPLLRALREHDDLERQAHTDGLTGLANREYLRERLEQELSRAIRHASAMSVLFADLDHFKRINDSCGHQCGDRVLREVAQVLRDSVRRSDVVGRYGGEEFAVILPHTVGDSAMVLAERLRRGVETRAVTLRGRRVPITLSVGVVTYPGRGSATADGLLDAADAALYEAKRAGRNCVKRADWAANGDQASAPPQLDPAPAVQPKQ